MRYRGYSFHRRRSGYWSNSKVGLLHRYVYEHEVGPIPDGWHIHHIDGDRGNNDTANLQALPVDEHYALHWPRSKEWHSAGGKAAWENREPYERICQVCGTFFQSRATVVKYCSSSCLERGARPRERRVCEVCGGEWETVVRSTATTCSPPCRAQVAARTRRSRL